MQYSSQTNAAVRGARRLRGGSPSGNTRSRASGEARNFAISSAASLYHAAVQRWPEEARSGAGLVPQYRAPPLEPDRGRWLPVAVVASE